MNLTELTTHLTKEFDQKPPMRIRNLTTDKFYAKNDLDKLLKEFPEFQEGGARCKLEAGRYADDNEISVQVRIEAHPDEKARFEQFEEKPFYFNDWNTLE